MVKGKKINKDAGEILKNAISDSAMTQIDIGKELHLSTKQLQNYSKGEFPQYKSDNIKKLDKLLGSNIYELLYEQKVPPGGKDEVKNKKVVGNEPNVVEKTLQDLASANKLLAEANMVFAEAQRNFSEANKTLAETNKQLTQRSNPIDDAAKQTLPVSDPRMEGLLGLIADVASGKKFGSRKEALISIHRAMNKAYPESHIQID